MKNAIEFIPKYKPSPENRGKAVPVTVTSNRQDLDLAEAEDRLCCPVCLEPLSLVERATRLNHFRHHPRTESSRPCKLRSPYKPTEEDLPGTPSGKHKRLRPSFRRELEKARQHIAHLTAENASSWKKLDQAWRTLKEVEEQLTEVKEQLKAEEREGHQAEEIILGIEGHWPGSSKEVNRLAVM